MKKILVLLFSILLLASCSSGNSTANISNGSDELFKGPNVTYTKSELFESLKASSTDAIVNDIIRNIASKYDIDLEAIDAEAQAYLDDYIANGYESYIISYYRSTEAFKESYASSMLISELAKIYVNEHFDEMLQNEKPVKMQMASFTQLEDAEKCIQDFNNGTTFDMAALNNNSDSSPQSAVYSDTDASLAFEVKEYLNTTEELGISPVITVTSSSTGADGTVQELNTYYVLNVENRNIDDFKDEYIEKAASGIDTDTLYQYLFTKHKIEFFDQGLYEMMSTEYEVLK